MLHDLHPAAQVFIQHPFRDQKLTSAGKQDLNMMRREMPTLPHYRDCFAVIRMMKIVDLGAA